MPTPKRVLASIERELRTCIALLETARRPSDRERGQLEALRHVRMFMNNLVPPRRPRKARR
jgi:hypothetical protein